MAAREEHRCCMPQMDSIRLKELSFLSRDDLMLTALHGDVSRVHSLLEDGASVSKANEEGETALILAAMG